MNDIEHIPGMTTQQACAEPGDDTTAREYHVSWEIALVASDPRAAAIRANRVQRDPAARATVYHVHDGHSAAPTRIDLADDTDTSPCAAPDPPFHARAGSAPVGAPAVDRPAIGARLVLGQAQRVCVSDDGSGVQPRELDAVATLAPLLARATRTAAGVSAAMHVAAAGVFLAIGDCAAARDTAAWTTQLPGLAGGFAWGLQSPLRGDLASLEEGEWLIAALAWDMNRTHSWAAVSATCLPPADMQTERAAVEAIGCVLAWLTAGHDHGDAAVRCGKATGRAVAALLCAGARVPEDAQIEALTVFTGHFVRCGTSLAAESGVAEGA